MNTARNAPISRVRIVIAAALIVIIIADEFTDRIRQDHLLLGDQPVGALDEPDLVVALLKELQARDELVLAVDQ